MVVPNVGRTISRSPSTGKPTGTSFRGIQHTTLSGVRAASSHAAFLLHARSHGLAIDTPTLQSWRLSHFNAATLHESAAQRLSRLMTERPVTYRLGKYVEQAKKPLLERTPAHLQELATHYGRAAEARFLMARTSADLGLKAERLDELRSSLTQYLSQLEIMGELGNALGAIIAIGKAVKSALLLEDKHSLVGLYEQKGDIHFQSEKFDLAVIAYARGAREARRTDQHLLVGKLREKQAQAFIKLDDPYKAILAYRSAAKAYLKGTDPTRAQKVLETAIDLVPQLRQGTRARVFSLDEHRHLRVVTPDEARPSDQSPQVGIRRAQ